VSSIRDGIGPNRRKQRYANSRLAPHLHTLSRFNRPIPSKVQLSGYRSIVSTQRYQVRFIDTGEPVSATSISWRNHAPRLSAVQRSRGRWDPRLQKPCRIPTTNRWRASSEAYEVSRCACTEASARMYAGALWHKMERHERLGPAANLGRSADPRRAVLVPRRCREQTPG